MNENQEIHAGRTAALVGSSPLVRLWLPIETAPKDDTPIDLWSPAHGRLPFYFREERSKSNVFYSPAESGICVVRDATHWMPIPAAPNT